MRSRAFTLIELLIVVAIIAILAAIAVPNFLEAQTRSKVARAKSDLRTIATALEAYRADTNQYPLGNRYGNCFCCSTFPNDAPTLERLTTPIAYLTGAGSFTDPFANKGFYVGDDLETRYDAAPANAEEELAYRTYKYWPRGPSNSGSASGQDRAAGWENADVIPHAERWFLECAGPDCTYNNIAGAMQTAITSNEATAWDTALKIIYDPTNGTKSRGSVWRAGGSPPSLDSGLVFYEAVSRAQ
jgi:type II secretion system protein G